MSTSWSETLKELHKNSELLINSNPAIMDAFNTVRKANHSSEAIDTKTRELIAIAVAIALHCEGCIASHVYQAKRAGVTLDEISAAIGTAMAISMGSSYVQSLDVLKAFEEL